MGRRKACSICRLPESSAEHYAAKTKIGLIYTPVENLKAASNQKIVCKYCCYSSRLFPEIRSHLMRTHNEHKKIYGVQVQPRENVNLRAVFNCETCDRTFSDQRSLRNHVPQCGGHLQLKCMACEERLPTYNHYTEHIQSAHQPPASFQPVKVNARNKLAFMRFFNVTTLPDDIKQLDRDIVKCFQAGLASTGRIKCYLYATVVMQKLDDV